jgi:hypothetical protein
MTRCVAWQYPSRVIARRRLLRRKVRGTANNAKHANAGCSDIASSLAHWRGERAICVICVICGSPSCCLIQPGTRHGEAPVRPSLWSGCGQRLRCVRLIALSRSAPSLMTSYAISPADTGGTMRRPAPSPAGTARRHTPRNGRSPPARSASWARRRADTAPRSPPAAPACRRLW